MRSLMAARSSSFGPRQLRVANRNCPRCKAETVELRVWPEEPLVDYCPRCRWPLPEPFVRRLGRAAAVGLALVGLVAALALALYLWELIDSRPTCSDAVDAVDYELCEMNYGEP